MVRLVLSFNPRPPEFHPDARWGGCCWLLTRKRGGRSNTLDAGSTGNACRCFRDPTPCLFHPPAEEVQSPRDRGSRYETERSYAVSLESQLLHPREPWRLQFKTYRPAYVLGSMPRVAHGWLRLGRGSPRSMTGRRAARRQGPAIAIHAWMAERVRRGPRRRNQAWETWARDGIPREAARNGRQEASR